MSANDERELAKFAEFACDRARARGAKEAAASASLRRSFKVAIRDGKQEEVKASVSRSLSISLYVDGRYGRHSTSVLSRAELGRFIDDAVKMTRLLMPDPNRRLPEPKWYARRSKQDLGLFDPAQARVTMAQRKRRALAAHDAARAATGDKVISVGAGASDSSSLSLLRTTNGFADGERRTSFWQWATVSAKDPSGRRPSDWAESGARSLAALGSPEAAGKEAARRTLATIGAKAIPSVTLPLLVENRAVGRLLGGLLAPLYGWTLDQQRSCFDESLDQQIASAALSVIDAPLLAAGWGSRRYDGEGITAKRRPVIDKGVLRSFFIDSYYGRKLKRPPTSGGSSNLVFSAGRRGLDALCVAAGKAILVTGFLGGNSNSTTGDFSHGIQGFLIEGGKRTRPLASMNIAGNHKSFWKGLQELGSDPYAHSSKRTPSLLFKPALVSGT